MWQLDIGVCLKTFVGHEASVNSLIICTPGIICSASTDTSIKFWNIANQRSFKELYEHQKYVS